MRAKVFSLFLTVVVVAPLFAHAQEAPFQVLVGIPGVDPNAEGGLGNYINALYLLSISLAGLLAVVKVVFAGAKYMLSDVVTSKQDALSDIRGALLGLLIVLAAALILYTINPRLNDLTVSINPVTIPQGGGDTNGVSVVPTTGSGDIADVPLSDEVTAAEIEEFRRNCGAEGGRTVIVSGKLTCDGNASRDTSSNIENILSDTSLSASEQEALREQFNSLLADNDITAAADIEGIMAENGASEVLWVVQENLSDFDQEANVESICNRFADAIGNEEIGYTNNDGYYACLVP